MKKFLISAALIGLVAAAAPASAQYQNDRYGNGYGQQGYGQQGYGQQGYNGNDVRVRIQRIDQRIDRLAQNRRISRREAVRLGQEVDRLRFLEQRYSRNGLTRWEQQDLQRRVYALQQQVREDRQDGRGYNDNRNDRYDDRYDYNRRYDRDDDDDD